MNWDFARLNDSAKHHARAFIVTETHHIKVDKSVNYNTHIGTHIKVRYNTSYDRSIHIDTYIHRYLTTVSLSCPASICSLSNAVFGFVLSIICTEIMEVFRSDVRHSLKTQNFAIFCP